MEQLIACSNDYSIVLLHGLAVYDLFQLVNFIIFLRGIRMPSYYASDLYFVLRNSKLAEIARLDELLKNL